MLQTNTTMAKRTMTRRMDCSPTSDGDIGKPTASTSVHVAHWAIHHYYQCCYHITTIILTIITIATKHLSMLSFELLNN